jgi:hypothetical protein
MDDFDVVTGPAPGLAAKLKPPAPVERKSAERSAGSPPTLPSPSRDSSAKRPPRFGTGGKVGVGGRSGAGFGDRGGR